jgi:LCP family protein required for cell wall assembly
MSGTSADDFFSRQELAARGPEAERPARRRKQRARLIRRIALASGLSLVLLVAGVVVAGYLTVNHLASSVHRISGIVALDAAHQPLMPVRTRRSMTVLLTSSGETPGTPGGGGVDGSSTSPSPLAGLIALVHLNASGHGGGVVSIPANVEVSVPGHGQMQVWNALRIGGPSLLIETVEHLTNVRIDHYSVIDFPGVVNVINAMGGVDVDVPFTTTSLGHTFHAGINHLSGATVLPYARQPGVSEVGRGELQSNLIRAILDKIASRHMFSHLATDFRVVRAMAAALSVDSNFSNSQLESLALRLGGLSSRDGVFLTAPTSGSPLTGGTGPVFLNRPVSRRMWQAIRDDMLAAFARRYPFTVTPGAPG